MREHVARAAHFTWKILTMCTYAWMRTWTILIALIVCGCADLSESWELDHPRVLGVQLSQPGLAALESATIEVLVVEDGGTPKVVLPVAVQVTDARGMPATGPVTATATSQGWTVTAAGTLEIDAARDAAGLDDQRPLLAQLSIEVEVSGQRLQALKLVRIGTRLGNPATPVVRIDGAVVDGDAAVEVKRASTLALSTELPASPGAEIDWLTSTGELTGSQTANATLTLEDEVPALANLVAIARTPEGGAAWRLIELTTR